MGTSYCIFLWPKAEADRLVLSKFVRSIPSTKLSLLLRCAANSKVSMDGRAIQCGTSNMGVFADNSLTGRRLMGR